MDFMAIAERLGVPVALLAVLCVFIFKVMAWLGNKVVLPITTSHIALVDETKKATTSNTETLKKMTDIMSVQSVNVDTIRRDVDSMNGKIDTALKAKK